MNAINNELDAFDSVSLMEISSVILMDRIDDKYVINRDRLTGLLENLKDNYSIVVHENVRISKYKTLYFDNESLDLYFSHHSGALNRYKVRKRTYVESDLSFFEIKFKTNKRNTVKSRIEINNISSRIDRESSDFLKETSGLSAEYLDPKLWVYYKRFTLVGKNSRERVTFDVDLSFNFDDRENSFSDIVIIEAKRERQSKNPPFKKFMKSKSIHPLRISKYCFGIATLYPEIKSNNFKKKIHLINKIKKEHGRDLK